MIILQQLLAQEAGELGVHSGPLPELPLPIVDSNETKVLLGSRPQPSQGILCKNIDNRSQSFNLKIANKKSICLGNNSQA